MKNARKKVHTSQDEKLISDFVSKSSKRVVSLQSSQKKSSCEFCEYEATTIQKMHYHMKTKHQNEKFKCKICNKRFENFIKMRRHLIDVHTEKNRFQCVICNAHCKGYVSLEGHIEKYHPTAKVRLTQVCDICGKQYLSKTVLENHMKSYHTGAFDCLEKSCKKRFESHIGRRKHYLLFHSCDQEVKLEKNNY